MGKKNEIFTLAFRSFPAHAENIITKTISGMKTRAFYLSDSANCGLLSQFGKI